MATGRPFSLRAWRRPKVWRRLFLVAANSLNSLLLPLLNVVISWLVIRHASVELWGAFVTVMIIVQLGAHIAGWGNKDYLLRAFSFQPAHITPLWQNSLITRLALAAGLCLIGGFLLPPPVRLPALLWGLTLTLDQSYDVLVLYKRDFVVFFLIEVIGIVALAAVIIAFGAQLSVAILIWASVLVYAAKTLAFAGRYRDMTAARPLARFDASYFVLAFPFFLLGLTGLLQSRIDLYTVNYFLSPSELGRYQVFINFMIYLQSISNFILLPFVKSLYRLNYATIRRLSFRLFLLGLIILAPGLATVYLIITRLYGFPVPLPLLITGGLFALPIFFYLPIIYALYKGNRQNQVLAANVLGIAINLGLNLLLVPRIGVLGAMTGSAIAQILMLILYLFYARTLVDTPLPSAST